MIDALFGGPVAANDNHRDCERCGKGIPERTGPGRKAKFCSDSCRYAPAITDGNCAQCDSPISGRKSKQFCGTKCRNDYNVAKYRALAVNKNGLLPPIPCAECGHEFIRPYGSHRDTFCSDRCFKRNKGRRARARQRAIKLSVAREPVNPIKVFERDKWKCQECGCKTPRSLRGTYDDRAPELDHIMPLSLGGAHSYMNTQCLCRKCNAAKSNTPPAQVSLFAYG